MDLSPIRKLSAEATPGPFGAWCEEGQTGTGRFKHSLCRNDQGATPEGELVCSFEETGHECVATVFGATEQEAYQNARLLALAVNLIRRLTDERALERAIKADPPVHYFSRRAADKTAYEVVCDTDPGGAIPYEGFPVVARFPNQGEAEADVAKRNDLAKFTARLNALLAEAGTP